jgi:hypothetical protein
VGVDGVDQIGILPRLWGVLVNHRATARQGSGASVTIVQDGLFEEPVPTFHHDDWRIAETTVETARSWVGRWHYSHRMPGGGTRVWRIDAPADISGIGSGRAMVACVMLSLPNNATGVSERIGLDPWAWPGNMEISRVVAHPEAPKNSPSKAIAMALRLWNVQLGLAWVFSYADKGQNHHGGIYQALNAIYVGLSCEGGRPGFLLDGEPFHPRSCVSRWGTQAWPRVQELAAFEGHKLERVEGAITEKHTYILPCGGPAQRRTLRRMLAPITLPYPKRDDNDQRGNGAV